MAEQLGDLTRTHTCGALRADDVGADVVLLGWVHRVRDLGGVHVHRHPRSRRRVAGRRARERRADADREAAAFRVRDRRVGRRRSGGPRTPSMPKLATGEVEVLAREIRMLNEAKTPPFQIAEDGPVSEDVRLRYRYLDLRRPRLQHQHRSAPPGDDGDPAILRRQRLLGDRDADPRRSRRPKARATSWCRAASIPASSTRCRSRRRSSSRS